MHKHVVRNSPAAPFDRLLHLQQNPVFHCSIGLLFTLRKNNSCPITFRINKVPKATCGLNFQKALICHLATTQISPIPLFFTENSKLEMIMYTRVHKFLKNLEAPSKLQTPKNGMKQVARSGPTILK